MRFLEGQIFWVSEVLLHVLLLLLCFVPKHFQRDSSFMVNNGYTFSFTFRFLEVSTEAIVVLNDCTTLSRNESTHNNVLTYPHI